MGNGGAKALGDMISVNKTIQVLDVSNNGFGKMQAGDQVKLKDGSIKRVIKFPGNPDYLQLEGDAESIEYGKANYSLVDIGVPALCAGVAASPSLISVSTTFRHALAVSFLTPPLISTMYVAPC